MAPIVFLHSPTSVFSSIYGLYSLVIQVVLVRLFLLSEPVAVQCWMQLNFLQLSRKTNKQL